MVNCCQPRATLTFQVSKLEQTSIANRFKLLAVILIVIVVVVVVVFVVDVVVVVVLTLCS